ncbi:AMP-binding protein [Psychromonas sp. L1A2]|uniref:AMP-binding protein n=1 Tax=Psychromonas sp. L1A2 TaxID=2686356 RepID=UPI00135AFA15|nr:AMP-binding protein [Psychromonas sp. L1A2]
MSILFDNIKKFADKHPEKLALRGSSARSIGTVELSYSQLWEEVNLIKQQIIDKQVQCIALRAENSIDWIMIDLASLLANVVLIPIPMFFSHLQVQHILDTANIDLLIGDWTNFTSKEPIKFAFLDSYKLDNKSIENKNIENKDIENKETVNKNKTLSVFPKTAKITFTSGSTGTPKGVCLSAEHLENVTQSLVNTINDIENKPQRHLILLPLSTLLENISGVYVPLQLGLCSVIFSGKAVGLSGSSHFDALTFCKILQQEVPQSLVLTPMLLQVLIQIGSKQPLLIESLKFVAVGGARVSPIIMEQAASLGIPAFEGYGLSECGSVVSLNSPLNNKFGSSGKPLPHCKVTIENDGEILVTGSSMLCYLGQQASKDTISTGDIGFLDEDGYLHITGRKSNLLITSYGRNISPEWIESEAQSYPELQGIVIMGDGQPALTAVVPELGHALESKINAIKKLNSMLPDYAHIGALLSIPTFNNNNHLMTSNGRPIRSHFNQTFNPIIQDSVTSPDSVNLVLIKE